MRVTNEETGPPCSASTKSFNPLYAGHKPQEEYLAKLYNYCFNPLYAGHKRYTERSIFAWVGSFNPLYAGHKQSMVVYLSILIDSFNPLYAGHKRCHCRLSAGAREVSIPYMRVTNHQHNPETGYLEIGFNPLYAGHKLMRIFKPFCKI